MKGSPYECPLHRTVETGMLVNTHHSHIKAEISTVIINWNGKPATFNFMIDINKRKQAEEERANLQARLSQAQKMESITPLQAAWPPTSTTSRE